MPLPTYDEVSKLLRYDPETGKLFWLERPREFFRCDADHAAWNGHYAGKEAFFTSTPGRYAMGAIHKRRYYAHRVAWLLAHGVWPDGLIDHINGDKLDNRIDNLRVVTKSENGRNSRRSIVNTSGVAGVHWDKTRQRWVARVRVNRRIIRLGRFTNKADAIAARRAASAKHGFTARHGVAETQAVL